MKFHFVRNRLVTVRIPGPWWRFHSAQGWWRRRLGRYDRQTLACFFSAWRQKRSARTLSDYLCFRRDLGCRAPSRLSRMLSVDFDKMGSSFARRRAVNLAAESGVPLGSLSRDKLAETAESSPSAAVELLRRSESVSESVNAIADMHLVQEEWRSAFSSYLHRHKGAICVVGNAGTVEGTQLGRSIDSHDVVLRFNRFSDGAASERAGVCDYRKPPARDIGHRLGVWVFAPDLQPPFPAGVNETDWIVLTGPDARYHMADWRNVVPLLTGGHKVLTIPLDLWRRLVRELEAPPSAGVLCLAWLMEMLDGPEGIAAAGFQRDSAADTRYHYALRRHQPSRRHNWKGERRLLRQWERQGLRFLD